MSQRDSSSGPISPSTPRSLREAANLLIDTARQAGKHYSRLPFIKDSQYGGMLVCHADNLALVLNDEPTAGEEMAYLEKRAEQAEALAKQYQQSITQYAEHGAAADLRVKELEAKVKELQEACGVIVCAFCGHAVRKDDEQKANLLAQHIMECEKHPLTALMKKLAPTMAVVEEARIFKQAIDGAAEILGRAGSKMDPRMMISGHYLGLYDAVAELDKGGAQ